MVTAFDCIGSHAVGAKLGQKGALAFEFNFARCDFINSRACQASQPSYNCGPLSFGVGHALAPYVPIATCPQLNNGVND